MTPGGILSLALCLTAGATIFDRVRRRRRRIALRRLASQWRMNYSPFDPLRLTARVAHHFPIPGAANLKVSDVIYRLEGDRYRYIFTAEFTVGVMRTKRRVVRAATFCEPRNFRHGQPMGPLSLAPADLPLVEQYEQLAPTAMQDCQQKAPGAQAGG